MIYMAMLFAQDEAGDARSVGAPTFGWSLMTRFGAYLGVETVDKACKTVHFNRISVAFWG